MTDTINHDDIKQRLEALIDDGLTISHVLDALSARETPKQRAMIEAAETEDGKIEVDTDSICSATDDEIQEGCYVLAWLWVDNPDFTDDDETEEV